MRRLLLLVCTLVISASPLHARGPKEKLSTPTFGDDGTTRYHYNVSINSTTATRQPYLINAKDHRVTTVQNNNNTDVLWSTGPFVATEPSAVISSFTSVVLYSNCTYFMLGMPAVSTYTVKITVETEEGKGD